MVRGREVARGMRLRPISQSRMGVTAPRVTAPTSDVQSLVATATSTLHLVHQPVASHIPFRLQSPGNRFFILTSRISQLQSISAGRISI